MKARDAVDCKCRRTLCTHECEQEETLRSQNTIYCHHIYLYET